MTGRKGISIRPGATLLLLGMACCPGIARAGLLTNVEKNAFVVAEAAAMTTSMIEDQYGGGVATLSFGSTTFTGTTWAFGLSGNYLGRAVSLSFSGTFSTGTNAGSFTSTGSVGVDAWAGSGTWSYLSLDAATDGLNFDSSQTIGLLGFFRDRHTLTPKLELTTDDGRTRHTVSQGKYYKTILGIQVGPVIDQTDDSIGPSGGNGSATVTVSLPQDLIGLSGSFGQAGGQIGGTVSVVPEPSAWLLVTLGLGSLLAWKRKKGSESSALRSVFPPARARHPRDSRLRPD